MVIFHTKKLTFAITNFGKQERPSEFKLSAEYSVDGGVAIMLSHSRMHRFENGTRFIWGGTRPGGTLDPIPSDARELIFKIISIEMSPAEKPVEVTGPWEFKIPLE